MLPGLPADLKDLKRFVARGEGPQHDERLLLACGHAWQRWENLAAQGLSLKDLDREEILPTTEGPEC